jgi:hypothetical protein
MYSTMNNIFHFLVSIRIIRHPDYCNRISKDLLYVSTNSVLNIISEPTMKNMATVEIFDDLRNIINLPGTKNK